MYFVCWTIKYICHCFSIAGVFQDTFKSLTYIQPEVLYPIPDFTAFDKPVEPPSEQLMPTSKVTFLSINRYERKKNLALAIEALGLYYF